MKYFFLSVTLGFSGLTLNIHAAQTEWTLDNFYLDDGGTVNGTFLYDAEEEASHIWNITVSGGDTATFPPFTYTNTNSRFNIFTFYPAAGVEVDFFVWRALENSEYGNPREIRLTPVSQLTDEGGVVPIYLNAPPGWYEPPHEECYNCAPYRMISSGLLVGLQSPPLPFDCWECLPTRGGWRAILQ